MHLCMVFLGSLPRKPDIKERQIRMLELDSFFSIREGPIPDRQQLLPVEPVDASELTQAWDYIYEPEAKAVLDQVMTRYIEALIFQAVSENMASEQSARMVAMKAASDNAQNIIEELQLIYNKNRQAAITKELSEIVGGAAAV